MPKAPSRHALAVEYLSEDLHQLARAIERILRHGTRRRDLEKLRRICGDVDADIAAIGGERNWK